MLQLNFEGLENREAWAKADVQLPSFDPKKLRDDTADKPRWIHIGPGNLFRGYIAVLAQELIEEGHLDTGIVVVSPTGPSTPESQYWPFDNLALQVKMFADGRLEKTVVGSVVRAMDGQKKEDIADLRGMFENPDLQMLSFTITEKGYQVRGLDGDFQQGAKDDILAGPKADQYNNVMSLVASMLYRRYETVKKPIAVVSMDNFSHNGDKLRESVVSIASEWKEKDLVDQAFLDWLQDDKEVAFPWSVIDKITPGPDARVAEQLLEDGLAVGKMGKTRRGAPAAGFVNTEAAEYLVIEDRFPNGRPKLEASGIHMTDQETVDKFERMKVCSCLNPLHTAMSVVGCLLGYEKISEEMADEDIVNLIKGIGYTESLPYVADPGIVEPKAFLDTVMEERLPNPYMPDTPQRIATDTSQKVGIRFGETIKLYVEHGEVDKLKFIPLAIASWLRYLIGVDNEGNAFEVSSDPLLEDLQAYLEGLSLGGEIDTAKLDPILKNKDLFRNDLLEIGLGDQIKGYFVEMMEGPGSFRKTLNKYVN